MTLEEFQSLPKEVKEVIFYEALLECDSDVFQLITSLKVRHE